MNLDQSSIFIAPLGAPVHRLAQRFYNQHANPHIAKRVYLNTLAVSAVQFYLECMGIESDRETSHSYNSIMQAMMDVADLNLPGMGRLECCPVLPEAQTIQIPPDVWSDRIGYVAVQLEPSLKNAKLLGFIPSPGDGAVPIQKLRSLDQLLEHLRQLKLANQPATLSHWLQGLFETSWRSLDVLIGTAQPMALSFRTDALVSEATVRRAKLLDLMLQLDEQSVVLLVAVTPEAEQQLGISVQVHPVAGEQYLPVDFTLRLLTDAGEALQEVRSRQQDNFIKLKRFRGRSGERFDIQIALGEKVSITESFVI
ncbi:DUF1822 family protein [Phormidium sp. FACHB-592]|uniref:DUF1822 family protein n=1 Tax=Stenomitos frigidus AS-A4 TaxID=2933935 RepID=A0ABV0KSN6_9CYAN|nr:DUF1822 family protein [Phormidium sp. FACHB-592]MBD2077169.1 DUF1822 family protein [Phormidium sp. FACHB-592]